jgi:hypothetical protein
MVCIPRVGEDRDATQGRLTIQEGARRLGVKEDAVRKRIHSAGCLPPTPAGDALRRSTARIKCRVHPAPYRCIQHHNFA